MITAGLTGGIGSGKSTVAEIFAWLGIPVYNSDLEAKRLMTEDKELVASISGLLGPESYQKDGSLNRSWIAGLIFKDETLLTQLNGLVHPRVFEDFNRWKLNQRSYYVIKESALLLKTLHSQPVDKVIAVVAPEEVRISRVMERDKMTREQVLQRIRNQDDDQDYRRVADYLILNDGNMPCLPQILGIHRELLNFAQSNSRL